MDDLTYNDDRHYAVNEAEGIDLFDEVLAAEGRYQAPTYDDDTVELSSRFDSRVTRRLTRLLNHRDDSAREFAMARLPTRVVWDDTVEPYILTLDGGPVMVRVIGRLVDINYGCTRTNTPTIRLHLNQVRVGDHIALVWLYETQAATPTHYPPHVVVERDVVEGQSTPENVSGQESWSRR
ncbi:hypothetical protein GY45DRAFT_498529 [Cubamyces sp. BRFM 1775]|nr:hypothetical protein GY45DRAFT_498529 [Cubamyces sp. BRFM 1775]